MNISQRSPAAGRPNPRQVLGEAGERLAAEYLERRGARILASNWRAAPSRHGVGGELDLVALIGHRIVAVEVKTRSGSGFGHPLEAITASKLRRLHLLLAAWAREQGETGRERRVDAVAVTVTPKGGGELIVRIQHRPGLG
ncbi:YraN family protein [Kocuria coralli]|uniref:UPF0102 protein FCK90_01675 n=1 Tax=Kocuria coralli TaxID=1461025 RepID=A0A5J5L1H0_9MICC|nr:YraN family protein [Kocuria coralli]KAA9395732.1 YraN family protein [Kocuria coralli]